MECANKTVKKEYNWEDIHSSRSKGGYPWTHLYKEPLEEELDPEPFTMEGLRKAKSSSTVGKSNIEIFDVTDFELDLTLATDEKNDTPQIVSEVDDHSINKNTGSVTIEECQTGESSQIKPDTVMDSAESWDNISQYLDNEDRGPLKSIDKEKSTKHEKTETKDNERKRKLSAESSYSKLSQTKSALMKKINDTKNKIKIPKLTFTASKIKKAVSKKTKGSPTETKKETNKRNSKDHTNQKDVKPVYVHIPLKPREGEEDEFSRLGLDGASNKREETKNEGNKTEIFKKVGKTKRFGGFKNLVKQVQESKLEDLSEKNDLQLTENEKASIEEEFAEPQQIKGFETTIEPEDQKMEIVEEDISRTEFSIKTKPPSFTIGSDEDISESEDNDQFKNKPENAASSKTKPDIFEQLFHLSSNKNDKEDDLTPEKQIRSKSVEPERKRKYSLESSYSRKSLSKLSLMKKLKEASEKIKNKLSRASSKQQVTKIETEGIEKVEKPEKSRKKHEPTKPKAPVYIHIPLKPPEGETDEFSHLEKNEKQHSVESELSSTPDSTTKSGVQFIILTAPSDDEILDYNSSDVPETPSSENKLFFPSKVTELKQLAKQAVDEVASPAQKTKLDSVQEESNGEKMEDDENLETFVENDASTETEATTIKEDIETKDEDTIKEEDVEELDLVCAKKEDKKKIMVDVEDGLNETKFLKPIDEIASKTDNTQDNVADTSTEWRSSIKIDSPKIKKKVSFKKRSKCSREDTYEDIQTPEAENKNIQSNSSPHIVAVQEKQQQFFEEENLPLQGPHVTFAEEKKEWSNIIDHEYEPVNPPLNDLARFPEASPSIYVTDIDYDASILPLGTIAVEAIAQKQTQNDSTRNTETLPQAQHQPNNADLSGTDSASVPIETNEPEASNFQAKIRRQSQNLRSKFQNLKRPEFKKPEFKKPEFKKFKIEKPKFNIPKIPDTAKINLPSFSLGRKHNEKRSLKDRQLSTEANDGDSKRQFFDFSTYPRIFKKKQKTPKGKGEDEEEVVNVEEIPAFATVPRTKKNGKKNGKWRDRWGGRVSIRVPLHSEESMDKAEQNDQLFKQELNNEEKDQEYLNDDNISNQPLESSHIRYDEDIDIDDDFNNVNNVVDRERDFVDRWNKGMFNQNINENEMEYLENFKNSNYKVTDLDSPDDKPTSEFEETNNATNMHFAAYEQDNNQNNNRYSRFEPTNNGNNTRYSSGSSLGHRRGVLEEIDSDEFIWRPKGISQEHIHIFASPEMREAFQSPINTLLEMEKIQDSTHDFNDSRRSLPEETSKRKPLRKPKRNKTPHTSNDRIDQSEEFTDDVDAFPPSRPTRRSRRKKQKNQDDIIPYRETIPVEDEDDIPMIDDRLNDHRESLGILGDDEQDEESIMSENDKIEARLQEEIRQANLQQFHYNNDVENNQGSHKFGGKNVPPIPPRKPKSIKSLNLSENDSIFEGISYNRAVSEDFSIGRNEIEPEIEAIRTESKIIIPIHQDLPPRKPTRTRSRTSLQSNSLPLPVDDTNFNESGYPEPCIEPPCVQDIRDPMGYAIIDKGKIRDPPLPPPRLPPRQKRSTSKVNEDNKFFTVPRSSNQPTPVRPLRNYSTLGQMKKSPSPHNTYENKENVNISQYVEIEDEPSKELLSGEVIKKMKDRPLPAPPRPPRKSRPLRDITSMENIPKISDKLDETKLEETEVSTQTEPLPDDFICDELVQEPTDKIIIPTNTKDSAKQSSSEETFRNLDVDKPNMDKITVEKRLITPTSYTYEEETITHGSLIVEPLNGAQILPEHELQSAPKERYIIIDKLSDDETSSIPEDFKKLRDSDEKQPKQATKVIVEAIVPEVVKAQKLQVADLDVDTLSVNKLVADKIICSDIESDGIHTGDISSKNATLKIGDISLPPGVIEEIIKSLTSKEPIQESAPKTCGNLEEKKTPITEKEDETCAANEPQLRNVSLNYLADKTTCAEHLENINISDVSVLPIPEFQNVPQTPNTTESEPDLTILEHSIQTSEEILEELATRANINMNENMNNENIDLNETPPVPPPRANSEHIASRLPKQVNNPLTSPPQTTILEPEIDDEPPPRPPEPQMEYIPSQPPASFYALKAQKYVDDNIPVAPRRKRHTRSRARSRSTSDDSSTARVSRRFPRRCSEVPLAQLSGQLIRACGNELNNSLKRLIMYVTNNVLGNVDGTQDLNVMILIVLVLIAGLILLGYGNEKTVVHLHHWEYFNPPKDL